MRRSAAIVVATMGLAACSSTAKSPTVAHTTFIPKAEIVIGCPPGERCPATVASKAGLVVLRPKSTTEIDSVASGSTVLVMNLAAGTHRVTGTIKGDQIFDTGQMKPGNTTTVVLSTPGGMAITDVTTGEHVTLTVGSRQVRG